MSFVIRMYTAALLPYRNGNSAGIKIGLLLPCLELRIFMWHHTCNASEETEPLSARGQKEQRKNQGRERQTDNR